MVPSPEDSVLAGASARPAAPTRGGAVERRLRRRGLGQLDGVARRVVQEDLLATHAGHDVVRKRAPLARSVSTRPARSETSSEKRFQPPVAATSRQAWPGPHPVHRLVRSARAGDHRASAWRTSEPGASPRGSRVDRSRRRSPRRRHGRCSGGAIRQRFGEIFWSRGLTRGEVGTTRESEPDQHHARPSRRAVQKGRAASSPGRARRSRLRRLHHRVGGRPRWCGEVNDLPALAGQAGPDRRRVRDVPRTDGPKRGLRRVWFAMSPKSWLTRPSPSASLPLSRAPSATRGCAPFIIGTQRRDARASSTSSPRASRRASFRPGSIQNWRLWRFSARSSTSG